MRPHPRRHPASLFAPLALVAVLLTLFAVGRPAPAHAGHLAFEEGDLFVSVGGGIIRRFDAQGNEVEDLDTETGSAEIGDLCFSENGLFSMNFQAGSVSQFDGRGGLVESVWATPSGSPESCVFDSDGNLYVGVADDAASGLQKFGADGDVITNYAPEPENSGVDQIDLAADQCTMLYTSEGGSIKAFDVCDDDQLPNFATGIGANCNNLRIRPNEEVLVACDNSVFRLDSDGDVVQTYEPADIDAAGGGLFALNLDPDGEHFYTATYTAGLLWRIDIGSGDGVDEPYVQTVIEGDSIGGVAIVGEISVAVSAPQADVPDIVRSVPDPTDISTEPDVVGTNVAFAVIVAIVILLSATIFNETIEENNKEIERFASRYLSPIAAPFRGLAKLLGGTSDGAPGAGRLVGVGVILVATAVIYGFLEPNFALDGDGIQLVLSIILALGVVTFAYSGVEARVTERRFSIPAAVKVYPVALGIAAASVLVSRLISFEPGIVFGFVASSVVIGSAEPEARQKGVISFFAMLALLAAFGVAWAAMIPFSEWAESDSNPLSVVLISAATLIVVGALETLAFTMVPIEFTDGKKIWTYNRVLWFVLAIVIVFLFWHVLLVQDRAGFEAIGEQGTIAALAAVAVCVGLTAAVWGFFYYRHRQAEKAPPSAPGAPAVDAAVPSDSAPDPAPDPPIVEAHPAEVDATPGDEETEPPAPNP